MYNNYTTHINHLHKTIIIIVELPKKNFAKGQLVKFDPCVKALSGLPFITSSHDGENSYILYSKIDLDSFPSWNDFFGEKVFVERGTSCIVIKKVGFPDACFFYARDTDADLHVYEVLVHGKTVHAFGCDLVENLDA